MEEEHQESVHLPIFTASYKHLLCFMSVVGHGMSAGVFHVPTHPDTHIIGAEVMCHGRQHEWLGRICVSEKRQQCVFWRGACSVKGSEYSAYLLDAR